ncbi:MAG: NAD(P)-dependent oxidoreductase [Planctomycetia bacterium]|nr:NAD(P)-dependent oxidoreductase [Planctomycetia bacterium]
MSEEMSFWRRRRVLVTGCTGFLGGAVARELMSAGATVIGLVRDRARAGSFAREQGEGRCHAIYGRVEDLFRLHSAMAIYEVSVVFHLAPIGTPAVVRAVKLYSSRIPVVTAQPIPQLAQTDERDECLSVARFGEVFGPGDRNLSGAVPATALGLLAGETIVPADGSARDFVFVRDAARACLRVAEDFHTNGAADYSFRSGWRMTDRQMCSAMRAVCAGRSVKLSGFTPPTNPLGWQPQQPFTDALNETLAWCRESFPTSSTSTIRQAA